MEDNCTLRVSLHPITSTLIIPSDQTFWKDEKNPKKHEPIFAKFDTFVDLDDIYGNFLLSIGWNKYF
ncbi:hypothetical protein POVCU2_0014530 [Plasmodium ovale curtisi]|uniref:Uncharacterized protein n=1 Tax=Plasmodium ovale curtisi TaxID=864141 RepID=A0A1A8W370_PLAOA|nr:hypothetical protein POVCU2_0014530 [Plasmodium ovale curtisi]SBS86425.1 hypothetical protein POVCU1_013490 [Plasmodium ovale curtisi]